MAEKVLQKIGGFKVVGDNGATRVRSTMPVPATATGTATLTTAQILNGFLIGTPAAAANYTLPLGVDLDAAVNMDVGEAFVFDIRNDAATLDFHITLVANTGWTLSPATIQIHAAPSIIAGETSFGSFAVRKTAAGAFTLYRIGA